MHRQAQEEVAAAARRRLALLGRELEQAGLRRVDEEPLDDEPSALPAPAAVAPAGRHAREPSTGLVARLLGRIGDQLPDTLRGRTELGSGPVVLVVALVALALGAAAFVVLRMQGGSAPVAARTASPP